MILTEAQQRATEAYLGEVFGDQTERQRSLMPRGVAAGLPDIAVSPDVGHLLRILASMSNQGLGAERIIEVGCLGGYSGIWLAQGLAPGGRLYTIEPVELHARFARAEFEAMGLADRVEVIEDTGLSALPRLAGEFGPSSVDVLFFDAIKEEYPAYLEASRDMLRLGGLLLADNVLGSDWHISDEPGSSARRDAVDAFNRAVAADGGFDVGCVANRQGLMVARKLA